MQSFSDFTIPLYCTCLVLRLLDFRNRIMSLYVCLGPTSSRLLQVRMNIIPMSQCYSSLSIAVNSSLFPVYNNTVLCLGPSVTNDAGTCKVSLCCVKALICMAPDTQNHSTKIICRFNRKSVLFVSILYTFLTEYTHKKDRFSVRYDRSCFSVCECVASEIGHACCDTTACRQHVLLGLVVRLLINASNIINNFAVKTCYDKNQNG